jgi:hypothetical protein
LGKSAVIQRKRRLAMARAASHTLHFIKRGIDRPRLSLARAGSAIQARLRVTVCVSMCRYYLQRRCTKQQIV